MHHRILRAIASQPWAISSQGMDTMLGVLQYRMQNGHLSAQDIEARLDKRKENQVASRSGSIAVIRVHGTITNRMGMFSDISGGASAEATERAVRTAYDDDAVKAIVIDMDTPGGSVGGIPELADTIRSLRGGDTPIVVQVNDMAASAGIWIASAADEIVASPSSMVGSIGVISVHEEVSKMLAEMGVTETIITSSPYKGEGNPYQPLTEEALEHLQDMVNRYDAMFDQAVAEGRGVSTKQVNEDFGQGRVMLAAEAVKVGLIDRVGTMRETLQRFGAKESPQRNRATRPSVPLARKRLNLKEER